jgi:RNA polymerase sigma-54 factor
MLESKNDEIELSLNSYNLPELRINKDYSGIIEKVASKDRLTPKDKETVLFVRQKIDAAKYFIEAVKQRQETMLNTMKAITLFQREYFATSDESKLRPMILRDISEMTGLDVTTVSRVVNSKYVQCDWGVFSLRHFFSGGIQSEMGEVSTREVKNIILECVDKEDKKNPMTDEELHQTLKDKGYNIARRTVAKYREKMNIPVARLRREI